MALTYNTYLSTMRRLLVAPDNASDADFEAFVPVMIREAELRMCREFQFLNFRRTETANTVAGSRDVTVPDDLVILEQVSLITPAGTANPDAGARVQLERVSLEFLNMTWTSAATTGTPSIFALLTDTALRLAPTPAAIFTCEFVGTYRPETLSKDNDTTFISTHMEDLFIAASMVIGAAYRQNYGAQSDDPKMAMSYETQYQTLKASAAVEEARKKALMGQVR